MTNVLNDEEFYRQTVEQGGASRHPVTNQVPNRGYMVGSARDRMGEPFAEQNYSVDGFTVDHIRHHAREIRDRFGDNTQVHQGSWVHEGKVYLDASERMTNQRQAVKTAKSRGEKAIYDLKRGQDIATS